MVSNALEVGQDEQGGESTLVSTSPSTTCTPKSPGAHQSQFRRASSATTLFHCSAAHCTREIYEQSQPRNCASPSDLLISSVQSNSCLAEEQSKHLSHSYQPETNAVIKKPTSPSLCTSDRSKPLINHPVKEFSDAQVDSRAEMSSTNVKGYGKPLTRDAQAESAHVEGLVESNLKLQVEVQELREELRTTQAKLEHSELEHIYKISTTVLEAALDEAQSREDSLRRELKYGEIREKKTSNILEDTRSREHSLINYVKEQDRQIDKMRTALEDAKSREAALTQKLKERTACETALKESLLAQLETAKQDFDHVQLAAEKAQNREEKLAETLKREICCKQKLAEQLEQTKEDLGKVSHDAKHCRAENAALARFVYSIQIETDSPEEAPDAALLTGSNCEVCVKLSCHLVQVKRANLSMAKKLKDYRYTATSGVDKIRRCQAWAEGTPQEKEIEAHELVKLLEKQLAGLKAENFTIRRQAAHEMKEWTEAKFRANLEVDHLTKLCAFKDIQISSMEADIGRVDSLQLHNAELLDIVSRPKESTIFEYPCSSFAEEISALTTRANTYEVQAQTALEEEAARRVELYQTSSELTQLKDTLEKMRLEKAQVDLEFENLRFCDDMKENEKKEIETAHNEALQQLHATIHRLQAEREQYLKAIPDDLIARDQYLYQIKCWEIDNLRANVQRLSAQIDQLQEVNDSNAYYAYAYEMLEAELNNADEVRDTREAGRSRFDRALRTVLESEYGHVDHLYRQAGERMKMESEKRTLERGYF